MVGEGLPVGAAPVDGGECGTTAENVEAVASAENVEAVASAEKLGFSLVWSLISSCSREDRGARIGVDKEASLYHRLRLGRLRAADGAESSERTESAERPGVARRGLGFCGGVDGYGN
jgi:hypothetical protein